MLPPDDEVTRHEDTTSPTTNFDEPVFADESENADFDRNDRFADPTDFSGAGHNRADSFDEPVFDHVWEDEESDREDGPPKAIAVGSSPKPLAVAQSPTAADGEIRWDDAPATAPSRGRRLGNTTPFWFMGAGLVLVLLFAIWLIFLREDNGLAERQLTPAPGLVGSAALSQGADEAESAVELAPQAEPTATAVPVFSAGQVVVVANTAGAGIRLRNQPGTAGLTLAIYQEGDTFMVLNPDGEYSSYPVEADGYRWYRIQITGNPEENLTGWAAGDFLQPSE